jgi:hypothetical protein
MRNALVKAVRRQFSTRLRAELPQFREAKSKDLPGECRLYEWKVSEQLRFYLVLQHHRHRDWFTLEIAWTRNGRWPTQTPVPASPYDEPTSGDMCFRLGKLWAQKDIWWEFAPRLSPLEATFDDFIKEQPLAELLPKVDSLVEDAIQHLLNDAMPYFRKVAAAHGQSCG